ncbi:MAG: hypothetical protein B0D91_14370 [Oceanospirillales bacterium LUC14_002_19_P2]|nr:MAG: hypothetical protein B0D91_14370 [Oceanospirillales bacterium LUC14_002_19_P2]
MLTSRERIAQEYVGFYEDAFLSTLVLIISKEHPFFIRDMFFRELKGFIFKTDDNGNILSISYALKIPPKYES